MARTAKSNKAPKSVRVTSSHRFDVPSSAHGDAEQYVRSWSQINNLKPAVIVLGGREVLA